MLACICGCRAAARRAASTTVSRVDYGPQFLVPVGVPRAEPSTVVCVRDAPQLRAEDRLVDVPVYPDFITEDEEQVLMGLVTKKLGKEKYERQVTGSRCPGWGVLRTGSGVSRWSCLLVGSACAGCRGPQWCAVDPLRLPGFPAGTLTL